MRRLAGKLLKRAAAPARRGWLVPTVCALVLLGLPYPLRVIPAAPPETVPGQVRIATWNVCGVRQWHCESTGTRTEKIQALKRLAAGDGARVVMLQEVCAGDLAVAREEMGKGWHSTFLPYAIQDAEGRRTAVRCADVRQGTAGLGLLAFSPLTKVSTVPTRQSAVGLHRGIVCATAADLAVRVCNAHLSLPEGDPAQVGREFRDDQLKSLAGAANGRTVFGGDLNSAPPSNGTEDSWIWPHTTYRTYRECDQESASSRHGRPTHTSGHKVDYLFTALPRTRCSVRDTGASDHRALIMQVSSRG
ncbi:endonuclease/exonuclease/phosphatase family protein [Streptomyces sp. NPDC001822]|uniref:endonuclease/exonuclease/phosphatase family protein n=1 Tax=Streptomyces sp. NPDC001822 TaxID=3364614 RepID=UPI0036CC923E